MIVRFHTPAPLMMGGVAFLVLFPLFFVYHLGVASRWFPPVLGGFFGPAALGLLPLLLVALAAFWNTRPIFLSNSGLGLFAGLMAWKAPLLEFALAVWHRLEPFTPGILGAAVAQAFRPGLGMRQRFVQWTVGVIFFHFVSLALAGAD